MRCLNDRFNYAHLPEVFALKMDQDLIICTIVLMQMMNLSDVQYHGIRRQFLSCIFVLADLAPKIVK